MQEYTSQYEKGELKAERDYESGYIEDAFTASLEAERFNREYSFRNDAEGNFYQFRKGYAARLHHIAVQQGPANDYTYGG